MSTTKARWTKTAASRVLAEHAASGLTVAEFARHRGLHPERLRRWQRRLDRSTSPAPRARMVELVAHAPAEHCGLQVHCPTGHRIEVTGVELEAGLRLVLAALAAGAEPSC